MTYDVEQQETLAAFKEWLDRYGNWMVLVALLLLAAVAGNWGWRWYQAREASAAQALYQEFQGALTAKDSGRARELAGALVQQYPSTAFARLAALRQARASLDAGDPTAAKAQLQWVVDKSDDKQLGALARVRLAGILLDEKAYEQGLALLQVDAPAGFAAEFSDRRGDLLWAQGKAGEARAAYAKALEQLDAGAALRTLIQTKLDALPAAG